MAPGILVFLALGVLGKDEVTGSNPVISSRNPSEMKDFFLVLGRVLQVYALRLAKIHNLVLKWGKKSQNSSHFGCFLDFFYYYMCQNYAIT